MAAAVAARRAAPEQEIILLERLPYYAFASCGLPEVISGRLNDISPLLQRDPSQLGARYGLTVLLRHEAVRIQPGRRRVTVRNLARGTEEEFEYATLILATGARPAVPERAGFHILRYPHELEPLLPQLRDDSCSRVHVSGGGALGLTLVDALLRLGREVHLYARDGLLTDFPPEITLPLTAQLVERGVILEQRQPAPPGTGGELTLLAHGIQPYLPAGLQVNPGWRQGVPVDQQCRTEVASILACGECTLRREGGRLTRWTSGAAAANRQGKVAGRNAVGGNEHYHGVHAVLITVAGWQIGRAGLSLPRLKQLSRRPATVSGSFRLRPAWLDERELFMRLDFEPISGKLLSCHAFGQSGVPERINQMAGWLQAGVSLHQLHNLVHAYHPEFSALTDPLAALLAKADQVARRGREQLTTVPRNGHER